MDLLQINFSERFREAVEAKQVAVQEAKRAEFEAIRAQRQADARVYLARGQAQAQQLLQSGLTPEILEHEAIGRFDFKSLLQADRRQGR